MCSWGRGQGLLNSRCLGQTQNSQAVYLPPGGTPEDEIKCSVFYEPARKQREGRRGAGTLLQEVGGLPIPVGPPGLPCAEPH